jgi:hypothetical protein
LFRDEPHREEPAPSSPDTESWPRLRSERRRPPKSRAKERESGSRLATAIVLSSLGFGIILVGLTAAQVADGKVGSLSGAAVVGVLTAVFVRRALGMRWGTAASVGVVTGIAVLSHIPEVAWPPWWPQMLAGYSIAIAGSVAILLTLPVRRMTGLPGEYAVAVLVATSGGGAAAMCLRGETLQPTTAGISIVAGLALALMASSGARTKLSEQRPSVGDVMYEWAFLFGVLIAAGALAVILILRGSSFVGELAGGVRPLIALPLAALGPGVVARAWTPSAWWACAGASIGACGVAIAVVALASGEGLPMGVSVAWSAILAALAGLALTVGLALSVNRMMQSTNPRAKRPVRRTIAEPGRLSVIV